MEDLFDKGLEGVVLAALEFVADGRSFPGWPDSREEEIAHAVGFHLDDHGEMFIAEGLVVVGAVRAQCGGVGMAPVFLEELLDPGALGSGRIFRCP